MPLNAKLIVSHLALVLAALLVPAALAPAPFAGEPPPAATPSPEAAALFERLKSLEGTWVGRSTKGWEDRTSFRTIAGGSVVVETSFDAHPGETMLTMFHLDGPRLMLTHYCAARNQPRMIAREIGAGGSSAVFTFLDATGIPSRDAGHMDAASFSFQDAGHFTSKWSWYEGGKERWMEEIRYERK